VRLSFLFDTAHVRFNDSAAVMMAPYSYGGTITDQIWVFTVAFCRLSRFIRPGVR
jgi:hypothetical protein